LRRLTRINPTSLAGAVQSRKRRPDLSLLEEEVRFCFQAL